MKRLLVTSLGSAQVPVSSLALARALVVALAVCVLATAEACPEEMPLPPDRLGSPSLVADGPAALADGITAGGAALECPTITLPPARPVWRCGTPDYSRNFPSIYGPSLWSRFVKLMDAFAGMVAALWSNLF